MLEYIDQNLRKDSFNSRLSKFSIDSIKYRNRMLRLQGKHYRQMENYLFYTQNNFIYLLCVNENLCLYLLNQVNALFIGSIEVKKQKKLNLYNLQIILGRVNVNPSIFIMPFWSQQSLEQFFPVASGFTFHLYFFRSLVGWIVGLWVVVWITCLVFLASLTFFPTFWFFGRFVVLELIFPFADCFGLIAFGGLMQMVRQIRWFGWVVMRIVQWWRVVGFILWFIEIFGLIARLRKLLLMIGFGPIFHHCLQSWLVWIFNGLRKTLLLVVLFDYFVNSRLRS